MAHYVVAGLAGVEAEEAVDAAEIAQTCDLGWEVAAVAPVEYPEPVLDFASGLMLQQDPVEIKRLSKKLWTLRLTVAAFLAWTLSSFVGREDTLADIVHKHVLHHAAKHHQAFEQLTAIWPG